ncbi:MAG: hypothetical protein QXU54_01330 [Candidatus Micrarchaeia archaeon]
MRYMQAIAAMVLTVMLVSAAEPFTVDIGYVKGTRVIYKDGVMQLSNCDMPESPQYATIGFEIGYPREACKGSIDIYYSYYDFPLHKYTDEELLCIAGESTSTCEGKAYLRFGGKGTGSDEMAEWAKFRAVCRKTGEEFTYATPAQFRYSPHNIEIDIASKISAADAAVSSARAALAQCGCCGEFSGTLSQLESQNAANKEELARCELVSLANKAITLKQNADALAESIRMASIRCAQGGGPQETPAETGPQQTAGGTGTPSTGNGEESLIPPKNENKPPATPLTGGEVPAQGVCPMGALLLLAAGALAFARKG